MSTPFAGRGFERQQAYRASEFEPVHAILREVFASLLIEALLHNLQRSPQPDGWKAHPNYPGHTPGFHEQDHFYRDQQVPKVPVAAGGPTVESLQQGLTAIKAGLVPAKAQAITTLSDVFFAAAQPLYQARSLAQSTGTAYTPNTTQVDEMNRAFKKLSLHLHPDKWADQPEKRAQAEALFKDMATLRDELNTATSAP